MSRYIDVDEEIRKINEVIFEKERDGKADAFTTYCFKIFANALSKAPTADVEEVRHGKWLCINGTIFCSECQEKALYEYNENDGDDFPFLLPMKSKRCPNCGAKMDEETKE